MESFFFVGTEEVIVFIMLGNFVMVGNYRHLSLIKMVFGIIFNFFPLFSENAFEHAVFF